jgi:hypothetical protein
MKVKTHSSGWYALVALHTKHVQVSDHNQQNSNGNVGISWEVLETNKHLNGHGARLMSCLNFYFGLGELDELGVVARKDTQKVHAGEEVVIESQER